MKEDQPIIVERTYNAPIEKVWNAITNKDEMKKWYFDLAEFKAEPGFEFQFYGEGKQGPGGKPGRLRNKARAHHRAEGKGSTGRD